MLGADVDRVELDAVTHHQCNRIAMSHADSGQSRGNIANLFAVRAPRQCSRIADVSKSHRVGRYRRHSLEGCTQRGHDVLLDAFVRADAFVGAAAVVLSSSSRIRSCACLSFAR